MDETLFPKLSAGDTGALSQAITLVESNLPAHAEASARLIEQCLPLSGKSTRIAISGTPGSGKSSLINEYGSRLTADGSRVAVLAVDPTSPISGGSILGDKTRMDKLAADPNAFVRPTPSRGTLGGVARDTREVIVLCEAAGYDTIIVETVGVGQSELAVYGMVDVFVLLGIAGAGDELQGIKRGALELADIVVVTKADGDNKLRAEETRSMIRGTVSMLPGSRSNWKKRVISTSVTTGDGIDEMATTIRSFIDQQRASNEFETTRIQQLKDWFDEEIVQLATERILSLPEYASFAGKIANDGSAPPTLAREFIDSLFRSIDK
ncbi:MAG: methylmalonyl Co-A mutase-associated GTPase MeaB [Rhodothermales bacterium]|nr:methylmalonyl Co-A mutase-associated GTPase MeaB [Rhodothermales bacterium]